MADTVRFLVIDGYSKEARDELVAGGASMAADLYVRMLANCFPGAHSDVLFASDPGAALPTGASIEQYDGIAWTGCSLTIFDDDPRVAGQVEIARRAYERGVPSFGSCWGIQMAVFAAGGTVRPHPRGREMGIARKIQLTPEGRAHPMYEGKTTVFDGFISHVDEVTHLPPGAVHLASNAFTHVQAAAVTHKAGAFWGLQYHPEYDLREMARLTFCRIEKLIEGGFFRDRAEALAFVERLETLYENPERKDLAWVLGIDDDLVNETVRQLEVRNWIHRLVLPSIHR
jgi:GMP synthase (glutamine-hydrolysing)